MGPPPFPPNAPGSLRITPKTTKLDPSLAGLFLLNPFRMELAQVVVAAHGSCVIAYLAPRWSPWPLSNLQNSKLIAHPCAVVAPPRTSLVARGASVVVGSGPRLGRESHLLPKVLPVFVQPGAEKFLALSLVRLLTQSRVLHALMRAPSPLPTLLY